jgi:hypothetical protein
MEVRVMPGGIDSGHPWPSPPLRGGSLRLSKSAVVPICRTHNGSLHAAALRQIRKTPHSGRFAYLAEREGFEPSVRYKRTPDFESGTFNRSATSPCKSAPERLRRAADDTSEGFRSQGGNVRVVLRPAGPDHSVVHMETANDADA